MSECSRSSTDSEVVPRQSPHRAITVSENPLAELDTGQTLDSEERPDLRRE
jgi:hypothetical protein